MCWIILLAMFWYAPVAMAQSAAPVQTHGYVTLANFGVYRGVRRSEQDVSLQAAVEMSARNNVFVALQFANASYRSFDGTRTNGYTLAYAVGWRARVSRDLGLDFRLRHNTFAQLADSVDYDYTELAATLHLGERVGVHTIYYDDGPGFVGRGAAAEMVLRHPWREYEVSVALGAARYFEPVVQSYTYWDAGASRPFGRIALDVRYHHTARTRPWVGRAPAHGLWVISATLGF